MKKKAQYLHPETVLVEVYVKPLLLTLSSDGKSNNDDSDWGAKGMTWDGEDGDNSSNGGSTFWD